jgi:hypothetical protein
MAMRGTGQATPKADGADANKPGRSLAADGRPLVAKLGPHAGHAAGLVRVGKGVADVLGRHSVVRRRGAEGSIAPRAAAAGGHPHAAHGGHLGVGLVRVREFVDPMDVLPSLLANQAAAPARMVWLLLELAHPSSQ